MARGQANGPQNSEDGEFSPFRSDKKRTEARLREIGIINGAVGFRNDLEDIFAEVAERNYDISEKKRLRNAGNQGLRDAGKAYRRVEKGADVVNKIEVVGIILLWIFTFSAISIPNFGIPTHVQGGLSALFAAAMWLISSHTIAGLVTAEQIGYQKLSIRLPDEQLNFRAKWNVGILTSAFSFIGVIIVGLLRTHWPHAYKIGLKRIRKWLKEKELEKYP